MTPSKKGLLKVEYVPIKSVKPARTNTKVHPPEQIDDVARSIQAFGWTKPIIVDERREIITAPDGKEPFVSAEPPKGKKVRHVHMQADAPILLQPVADNDSVWTVGRDHETIHPTQKPVELARRAIKNSSREGEIVLDFFAGSGSTLIGCEQLQRVCYAIDLEPRYVDAIIRRWETTTGKQAIHAEEKKTHEAIAKARNKAKARTS